MKHTVVLTGLVCLAVLSSTTHAEMIGPLGPNDKVAMENDGNYHDRDDICALAAQILFMDAWGFLDRLVHVGHSNHMGRTDDEMHQEMQKTASEAKELFGIADGIIYDHQAGDAGWKNLRDRINETSASSHLWILGGGPFEQIYKACAAADENKYQFITVVTHHGWNSGHNDAQNYHTLGDVADLGVPTARLESGSKVACHWGSGIDDIERLDSALNDCPKLNWFVSRVYAKGSPDFTDASMTLELVSETLMTGEKRSMEPWLAEELNARSCGNVGIKPRNSRQARGIKHQTSIPTGLFQLDGRHLAPGMQGRVKSSDVNRALLLDYAKPPKQ